MLLDGKKVRDALSADIGQRIQKLSVVPCLAIIQVGHREDSNLYVAQKIKTGEALGFSVAVRNFEDSASEEEITQHIQILNQDKKVHGIIVQLPLPASLDATRLIETIAVSKDVDGLTSVNVKKLVSGSKRGITPATARGVLSLLDFYDISVTGKNVVVVGRSALVGKPIALSLLTRDATVTVCHSKTQDLKRQTTKADILIVATGHPKLITKDYVSKGQVVVDVGINLVSGKALEEEIPEKKLVGDVDFDSVKDIVEMISPVPGGVGPLTVISLLQNVLEVVEQGVTQAL
jgi:methylenetetrahydrofolate dehydrogenase (NADP+)/methenyltetrahydrofolate cyclohydrolase